MSLLWFSRLKHGNTLDHRAHLATLTELFRAFCHVGLVGETLESSGRLGKRMGKKKKEKRLEEKTLSF